jgi:hypothetical protein
MKKMLYSNNLLLMVANNINNNTNTEQIHYSLGFRGGKIQHKQFCLSTSTISSNKVETLNVGNNRSPLQFCPHIKL